MAAVYGIVVGMFVYKELKLKDFPQIIFQAVIGTTVIMFLVGAATVFGWLITNLQIPHQVAALVVSVTTSPLVFLMAMNILLLIAGTLVNASAAVVILTPIFLPVAKTLGIDPALLRRAHGRQPGHRLHHPAGGAGSLRGERHRQGAH